MDAKSLLLSFLLALPARAAAPLLGDPLSSDDAKARLAEVYRISQSTSAARLPDLLAQFKREDSREVRLAIVAALAKPALHNDAAAIVLGHALSEDLSDQVRAAAGTALLSYEGTAPIGLVDQALLTEQGEGVRLALCQALSTSSVHANDPAIVDSLSQIVSQDASVEVRLCAVRGLERRGDRRGLPVLNTAAAHDADPEVRKEAKRAFLALIAPPKSRPALKPKPPPLERVDETGHLHCGADAGVCQCSNGVLTPKPHCLSLDDCRHLYETSYQNEGTFGCTWDGQDVEQQR